MKFKLLLLLNIILIFLTIVNFGLSQSFDLKTLFRTDNFGFKFITKQSPTSSFELSSDNNSAYLKFNANNINFAIRPSHPLGSIIYSYKNNDYGGTSSLLMNMNPSATSVIFKYEDTARSGVQGLAKIYANLEDSIAIYNCSWMNWLWSPPASYTCLGKYGYYKDGQYPPGASSTNNYWNGARIYINPNYCFGDQTRGRVLQEICTGDCTGRSDDSALTICVLNAP
ncbi:MAG: hypothetical protein KatS3mg095_0189 [Candidatus Parcubacteria bacterium]|nr:MAG: hypothetical protein KatS3mg095_0189 [Candidatus Parcubacteria bacterium]